ncbi:MAG: hypothetical protein LBH93_02125, partial [Chitinispirillales bacterium]|nr:hypothetical protein [Chitinispirillales bacterium]
FHGGTDYRLTKQFINSKSCLVERIGEQSSEYTRFMEADSADAWLRGLMSSEAAPRGVSRPEHWGLAGLLWIPQGGGDYCGLNGALMKKAAEQEPLSSHEQNREGRIESALKQEYLKYFTEKSGKASQKSGSLGELEGKILHMRGELDKRQRQLEEMASLRDGIDAARKAIADCGDKDKEICGQIREAEDKRAEYDKVKAEHEMHKSRLDIVEMRIKGLERDMGDIKEARNSVERYRKLTASRTRELEEAQERLKNADVRMSEKITRGSELDSLIKLEFTAEAEVIWEPIVGEPSEKRNVSGGGKVGIAGIGRIEVRLPSVGTIAVTGPISDNAAALQEGVNTLKREMELHLKSIDACKRDINSYGESIERANDKISRLLTDGISEERINEEHRNALGERHVLKGNIEDCKNQVLKIGYNPHAKIDELKTQSENLRKRQESKLKEISEMTGQLKALGGMGLHDEAGAIEEEVQKLQARFDAETLRAKAFKLIWETISAVKREFQEQVATPVEKRASELFKLVNEKRLGTVKLSGGFGIVGFAPEGLELVDSGCLSGGEREQLCFCARLALAERVIGDGAGEKYPLAIDDFLTATDGMRLSRLKELLLSFEDRYQYLIFTCHQNRYNEFGGKVIEL